MPAVMMTAPVSRDKRLSRKTGKEDLVRWGGGETGRGPVELGKPAGSRHPGRLRGLVDMKSYREAGPRFLQVHPTLILSLGTRARGWSFSSDVATSELQSLMRIPFAVFRMYITINTMTSH